MNQELFYPTTYRVYRLDDNVFTLVHVTDLNLTTYEEDRFLLNPDNANEILEFQSEKEGTLWLNQRIKPHAIHPHYRTLDNTSSSTYRHCVYRPYVNDYGLITLVQIENENFEPFVFARFIKRPDETYIEFMSKDEGIHWINQTFRFNMIDPQIRPLDLTQYCKDGVAII